MPKSNHAILGLGLKLYSEAMRTWVRAKLTSAYGDAWWEQGVHYALTTNQQQNLKRDREKNPGKDELDLLEPTHFVRIVARNFDEAFKPVFGDFQKTQSWLMAAATARGDWAHPRSGDMPADDVGHALYAMAHLLAAAKLPEASGVEKLRKSVLGITAEPGGESAPSSQSPIPTQEPMLTAGVAPVAPAPTGQLPFWWQKCEPHDAFKNLAAIDESLFAATLGTVFSGSARNEYQDPKAFFSHTYFTENLKQTVRDVASRMRGGDGPSVTEMQTPFGGGKTHALLTLYHLIKDPRTSLSVPGVQEALGDVQIPPEAKVLVFDGQDWGTEPVEKETGATVSTMWGELAHQVDPSLFRELLAGSDERGEAPGNQAYRKVLDRASPCLILIDELVSYLVKLRFSNARRTQNLYRQTVQFVQELLQLAGNMPGVCVLISLPKSKREFGGLEPAQLQMELGIGEELQARADRVVSKRTPVNDDEIYTLVRKRLFKHADEAAAARVAQGYQDTYARTRGLYDGTIFTDEYRKQQVAAYPIHPELIDVLYKKWSTAADFPRTRAVLQLLANVVADQWTSRREAYSIQSAHVSLERERIRTRIVGAAGAGGGYDAVVAADIVGGHADMQDQQRGGEYEQFHVARGVATTLLMHSFGGATRAGALPSELYLGSVSPNLGPEYLAEVLRSLEESLWYVHTEGELLRFQTKFNIYRVLAQTAETQPSPNVVQRLQASVGMAIGSANGFKVLEWAASDGAIADRPEPTIAVLDPTRFAVAQENGDTTVAGKPTIEQLWEKSGGGLREWRNALVLIAADRELWARADEAMREVMAYETVLAGSEKGQFDLSNLEVKELKSRFNDKKESLRTSVTSAYRWVFYPDEQGLTALSLPVPATKDERVVSRAVDRLSDQNYGQQKILRKMSAVFFNSKLSPKLWKDDSSALELGDLSRRFLQWTYLPILPQREETLQACIREGLGDRLWAVAIGDSSSLKFQRVVERQADLDDLVTLFDGAASLVRWEMLDLIREAPKTATVEIGGDSASLIIVPDPDGKPEPSRLPTGAGPVIPPAPKRYGRVRLRIPKLRVAKTTSLQPYLFRVLQEQDAGAEMTLVIEVDSEAGIDEHVLQQRIVEGLDQLGITVTWERIN